MSISLACTGQQQNVYLMKPLLHYDPDDFRSALNEAISELSPSLIASPDEQARSARELVMALEQSMDIMARVNADTKNTQHEPLAGKDITQIGDYALNLLEELSIVAANRGLQQSMVALHRLALPVASWIHGHGGEIIKLDIIVNAVASYANQLREPQQLAELCNVVSKVVAAVAEDIRRDLEATNPMRPWRVLNINWGIIATRSHDEQLMQDVFDQMVINIPADARRFFSEGMQQMDIVGYPDNVRAVMEKYSRQWGLNESLH
ncbi:MAG: hypothetical protein EP315_05400 [Gammaproteobacteria bacterium]|nr:MAG: hypothetical protein EP315_05400 [Gammaproteobacteria bacterium]